MNNCTSSPRPHPSIGSRGSYLKTCLHSYHIYCVVLIHQQKSMIIQTLKHADLYCEVRAISWLCTCDQGYLHVQYLFQISPNIKYWFEDLKCTDLHICNLYGNENWVVQWQSLQYSCVDNSLYVQWEGLSMG